MIEPVLLADATMTWGWPAAICVFVALEWFGHFALHLVLYNRINATGMPRYVIKIFKFLFLGTCLILPVLIIAAMLPHMSSMWKGQLALDEIPLWIRLYSLLPLLTIILFGPHWLISRPSLHSEAITVPVTAHRVNVQQATGEPLARSLKCRIHARLPLNQLFELQIEQKEISVQGLPAAMDGFKIAHLSDIHLTGHVSPRFYRYAIEQANEWAPDLVAMTGDIVDKQVCIPWLDECFATASARYGCYFVLGNHDLRVKQPQQVRDRLSNLGWIDLGGRVHSLSSVHPLSSVHSELELIGNESPWFLKPTVELPNSAAPKTRILLSHSPDQIQWARRHHITFMMAGHTHGGQGRLPWIGPVLSPSYYGSRYASGTFYLHPTTMHVTRGMSGVHLMRIACPPELALLTLRCI